jgi:hypothetical protein
MSEPTPAPTRFTLRLLPLPAKLVIATFLMAVGVGYTSALVQMHFAQANKAAEPTAAKEPMPTFADVILHFTGKKWQAEPETPRCTLERMVAGEPDDKPWPKSMASAFYGRDGSGYNALTKGAPEERKKQIDADRKGEQDALIAWANADPVERIKGYRDDTFKPAADKNPAALTPEYRLTDGAIKVRSIITDRCIRCHMPGGQSPGEKKRLDTYEHIDTYLQKPKPGPFRQGGDYVRVQPPVERADLARSTHAHLLSFAMLFALTGLTFAYTSYPGIVRGVIGPGVLVAQIADIACWWLARESEAYGPYFAIAVVFTGGAVGTGLALQIVLSLFNMFGTKGKVVLLLLFAGGGGLAGALFKTVIQPALAEQKAANGNGHDNGAAAKNPADPPKVDKKGPDPVPVPAAESAHLVRLLTWPAGHNLHTDLPWSGNKEKEGGMIRALFDRSDRDFKDAMKNEADKTRVLAERETERAALLAWVKAADADRKAAYDADKFPLPPDLAGKPLTADFKENATLKVASLLKSRCVRCHHAEDGEDEDAKMFPLDKYQFLEKYLPANGAK